MAVPLTTPPESDLDERKNVLVMELTARPSNAPEPGTVRTTTAPDWIVENRAPDTGPLAPYPWPWIDFLPDTLVEVSQSQTIDPARERLRGLTQRREMTCGLSDPSEVLTPVLVALPRGLPHPDNPAREVWPEVGQLTATVRPKESGFIDRKQFDSADRSAFSFATDSGVTDATDWAVVGTEFVASGPAGERRYAFFGEDQWQHLHITVTFHLEGDAAGIGVSMPDTPGTPHRGLFALVERLAAGHRLAVYRRESGTEFTLLGAETLPELPTGPLMILVTSFDDRLRIEALETVLEVDRGSPRQGRLALVADGQTCFKSLAVEGLTIYRYPVTLSRYTTFKEHVESFEGTLGTLRPDDLGPGTTSQDVTFLWLKGGSKSIPAAMAIDTDPALREGLFASWVKSLGLPFQDHVEGLDIARIVDGNGATTAFLIESAEPIDLVSEVSVQISEIAIERETTRFTLAARDTGGGEDQGGNVVIGDTPIEFQPLQGADRLRAILIPTVNGDHYILPPGDYDLMFFIHRDRWETTASPTNLSHYQSRGSLRLAL